MNWLVPVNCLRGVGGFVDQPQHHQEVMQQPALHSVALLIGLSLVVCLVRAAAAE